MDKDIRIILTEDGSHSLYSSQFKSSYHSTHGAITESQHIFIEAGLSCLPQPFINDPIRILETGFGSGLNALLSYIWANKHNHFVDYLSLEKYPISFELAEKLNYPDLLGKDTRDIFLGMHRATENEEHLFGKNFKLKKSYTDLLEFPYPVNHFHLIFFDPFDFSTQAELWHFSLLEKLYFSLKTAGSLLTYGARGAFKRDLRKIGFEVEGLPGPPGKREISKATKI